MEFSAVIMDLFSQAVLAMLGLLGMWLLVKMKALLKSRAEAEQAGSLDKLIYQFVEAAEQQLKKKDPSGTARKQYVTGLLEKLGYEVNAEINARIEAAVYALNLGQTQ